MTGPSKEAIYDDEISPLMAQILEVCKARGISMVAHFAIPTEDEPDLVCTSCLPDETGEFGSSVKPAYDAIMRQRGEPPVMLTTRDADGKVLSSEVFVP